MKRYRIPYDQETLSSLEILKQGVRSIRIAKDFPHSDFCHSCWLQIDETLHIQLQATGEDLAFKFEVFPLSARPVQDSTEGELHPLVLTTPIEVIPLVTDSWLDPAVPVGPTVGADPVAQFVGMPGSAPFTASMVCHYLGGVEIRGSNGNSLLIATGSFPYSLHVSGFYEDPFFNRDSYVALSTK